VGVVTLLLRRLRTHPTAFVAVATSVLMSMTVVATLQTLSVAIGDAGVRGGLDVPPAQRSVVVTAGLRPGELAAADRRVRAALDPGVRADLTRTTTATTLGIGGRATTDQALLLDAGDLRARAVLVTGAWPRTPQVSAGAVRGEVEVVLTEAGARALAAPVGTRLVLRDLVSADTPPLVVHVVGVVGREDEGRHPLRQGQGRELLGPLGGAPAEERGRGPEGAVDVVEAAHGIRGAAGGEGGLVDARVERAERVGVDVALAREPAVGDAPGQREHPRLVRPEPDLHGVGGRRARVEADDPVVLALDPVGLREVVASSPRLGDLGWREQVAGVRSAPRFAVWRLWLDGLVRPDRPPFLGTSGHGPLDNVSVLERFEDHAARWSAAHAGSVVELHAYAVPDGTAEDDLRAALLSALHTVYPETTGLHAVHDEWLVRADCVLVGTEPWAARPGVATPDPRVVLAGDAVRCDLPVALMERAATTGWLAADRLLTAWGLPGHGVWSVPLGSRLGPVPSVARRGIRLYRKAVGGVTRR